MDRPPPPSDPPLSEWANFSLGLGPINSGAFGASQFRPQNFFGASHNSGSPEGGGPPTAPPPPRTPLRETLGECLELANRGQ